MNAQPGYGSQVAPGYGRPAPPGPPPSPIPPWARFLALGCGALLLLGSVGGTIFVLVVQKGVTMATAGPEETVQGFLAAAAAGDFATAHGHFSEALKAKQPYDQFAAVAGQNQQLFAATDTTFNSRSIDLGGARLAGTLTLQDGTELPASFELVQEGGQWRLIAYQIGSGG